VRLLGLAVAAYLAFGFLLVLARNRLIFPASRDRVPEPSRYGMPDGERVTVPMDDGTPLVGWYLPPREPTGARAPALLWFHGNGETVAGIAPVLREFRPPHAALLALDYRGYGESGGRPTVVALERDAVTAFRWLAARPDVDAARIVVYGRSVGAGPAAYVAANEPVAGLILESAFTALGRMAQSAFPLYPTSLLPLGFDNEARIARVRAPILLIQGDSDEVVPFRMRAELEAAAGGHVETWTIAGAGHNETYDTGGDEYVRRVHRFIDRVTGRAAPQ
jgi:fermentation-respiration switch protein FrsA (DUF1100 family)